MPALPYAYDYAFASNTTITSNLPPISGKDGIWQHGAGLVYLQGTITVGGPYDITAGAIVVEPLTTSTQAGATTVWTIGAGLNAYLRTRTAGTTLTVNGNFFGGGSVNHQQDITGATTTILTGTIKDIDYASAYGIGTFIVNDMPKVEMKLYSYNGNAVTASANFALGTYPTPPTITPNINISAMNNVATTYTFNSNGNQSFITTGRILRGDAGSVALLLVLGGAAGFRADGAATNGGSGIVNITKNDGGTVTLNGNNSAFGNSAVTLNGGTIAIGHGNALGAASSAALTMAAGTTFTIAGNSTFGKPLNAINAVTSVGGNNSLTGTLLLNGPTAITNSVGGTTLTISNAAAVTGAFALTLGGAGNVSVTQAINTGSTVTKPGGGVLTLSALSSTFSTLTIGGGVVSAARIRPNGSASSIGVGPALAFTGSAGLDYFGTESVSSFNRTMTFSGATEVEFINSSPANASWSITTASANFSGVSRVSLTGTSTNQFNVFATRITGTTSTGFLTAGYGRWIVTGGNDLTGNTLISIGSTLMAASSAWGNKLLGGVTVQAGGKMQTSSDGDQKGRCSYNGLTFSGSAAQKARLRIGGSATSPTLIMDGNITPASSMEFDLSADTFKTPGTYTLVEFVGSAGMPDFPGWAGITVKKPTGCETWIYTLDYALGTPNKINVTVTKA